MRDEQGSPTRPGDLAGKAGRARAEASENRGHEIELKLRGDPVALEAAFGGSGGPAPRARRLVSTYFDTGDGDLRAGKAVFRIRKIRRAFVATFKKAAAGSNSHVRDELEAVVRSPEPDISCFGDEAAAEIRDITGGAALVAQFTTDIRRRTRLIEHGGALVEAALDTGFVRTERGKEKICELELELKSGDIASLYDLAETLAAERGLSMGVLTKGQRGFMLALGEGPAIRKSRSPKIPETATLEDLIQLVGGECLDQFTANWPALDLSDDPESIHQMRVGLRRLRTALALFNRALPCPDFQRFRETARDLASALGPARDTDAFIDLMEKGPVAFHGRDESCARLLDAARARRGEGYARARALAAAPETTRFVLAFRSFLARRGWRNALTGETLANLGEPAADFAARTLRRLDRRALKRGRKLASLPPAERHELRIALKNIRYAADFFSALFDAGATRKYNHAAAGIQEVLGAYNDAIVAAETTKLLEKDAHPHGARAAGMVLGWTGRGCLDADHFLLGAWKAFRKAERFW